MALLLGGITIPVLSADPVDNPDAGSVFLYSVGSSYRMKTSSGTVLTFATGVTPEDVQDIVGTFLQAGSSKVIVGYNDALNVMTIDIDPTQIAHGTLANSGTNSHAQIDSHLANTSNPHGTTAVQVGADPVGSAAAVQSNLNSHTSNTLNPHATTKAQVGLGNADNTSDADKPVSTATQSALNLKYDASNPNGYETPAQLNARDTANRSRANHTGSQLAATISDFASVVIATLLAGFTVGANTAIAAADSILVAFGKVQGQINFINSVLQSLVLGDQFENFEDNTAFTTTANTNQVAASFLTASKPTGKYRIGIEWDWSYNSATNDSIYAVFLDGVQVSQEFRYELSDTATQLLNNQFHFYKTFATVQTHTLELRCRAETAGSTVNVSRVRAEIWRATP